ncbi:MAG: hypothetical protein HFJ53_04410 [Clostridia bacterium]|jgi:hypothetical protein|nr:hypothetical protein [Clostridia bacterium]
MELMKNIFFNTDKLIENTKVKISYTGKLFQDNAEKVFIHYGFGLLWNNVDEIEMEKTELGFQCEVELSDLESFNFCFKDTNNNWDNNYGANYIFPIEKNITSLIELQDDNLDILPIKKLRKSYIWSKKIRIAIYKIITYFPKIISGNYKRKISD